MTVNRIAGLRKTLQEKNIDALLVSNFYNILYLAGFKTLVDNERESWLLVTKNNEYVFTDSRYSSDSHNIKFITPKKRLIRHLQEITDREGVKTLGFESTDLKYFEYENLKKNLNNITLISTLGLIIKQREIKDDSEIANIKKACEITDRCLEEIVTEIKAGQTEKEIAFRIEFFLKELGYDLAFYPIVAVNENSAIPHYDTRNGNNKKISNGSIILLDFGVKYKDYLSDITRMVFVGNPKDEIADSYHKLLLAQQKTIIQLKTGADLKSVDSFCRQHLTANYPPQPATYSHSTGHGVGLEIHEYPKISAFSEDKAAPNQVVTVEPGIYIPGKWGMRIEDTVLIKKEGVEVLTKFNK